MFKDRALYNGQWKSLVQGLRKMSKNMLKYSNSQDDKPFSKLFYYTYKLDKFFIYNIR